MKITSTQGLWESHRQGEGPETSSSELSQHTEVIDLMRDVSIELGHLRTLAARDPTKRFNRLHRLLQHEGLLALARTRIATNHGAHTPGIDGQTMADVTEPVLTQLSAELTAQGRTDRNLSDGSTCPRKTARCGPSASPPAGTKSSKTGIALILEALYEPLFRPCSHGFRPGHSPITALRQVSTAYRAGATWIIEGDITNCFGSLPHGIILNCLRKRITG